MLTYLYPILSLLAIKAETYAIKLKHFPVKNVLE